MVVDLAWDEVADDEVATFEDLMRWGWLMDLAGNRHEVVDAQSVGIQTTVPAHDVEGVVRKQMNGASGTASTRPPVLDVDLDVRLVNHIRIGGAAEVSFAVGRVFKQLAELRQVVPRGSYVGVCFNREDSDNSIGDDAIGGRTGKNGVVAISDSEIAELRLHGRAPTFDVEALVSDCAPVVGGGGISDDVVETYVSVAQQQPTVPHRICSLSRIVKQGMRTEMERNQGVIGHSRLIRWLPCLEIADRGWDSAVVEEGRIR